MKTNRILAVALSAGLVLGRSYVADTNLAYAEETVEKTLEEYKAEAKKKLVAAGFREDSFVMGLVDGASNKESVDAFVEEAITSHQVSIENNETGYSSEKAAKEAGEKELAENKWLDTKEVKVAANTNGDKFFYTFVEKDVKVEAPSVEDDTQQTPDWKQGLYTESQLEEALATARGDLLIDGLQDIFDVRAVYIKDNERGEKLYAIERFEKPIEEEKPENPEKPEKPEIPEKPENPVIPETPIEPGETDKPIHGGDDKVEVPEEKEEEKEEKEKDSKEVEEKEKENKEKEEKPKEEAKPGKKKGNNPKTGVASVSLVAGTLAISMAGIVASRKKND